MVAKCSIYLPEDSATWKTSVTVVIPLELLDVDVLVELARGTTVMWQSVTTVEVTVRDDDTELDDDAGKVDGYDKLISDE